MSEHELQRSIDFGLENAERIHLRIATILQTTTSEEIKTSALAYECLGYYNAIEHLIVRIFKHLQIDIPTGPFSHRDTLARFESLLDEKGVAASGGVVNAIENLMAFRHVATKIYGFLIDLGKLQVIVDEIRQHHAVICQLFKDVTRHLKDS